ncbi:HetP family heterocyst commitment protein [Leptolyngbya ohadii]|uniref:HetP family heterocyst commitment protein n=1 Tax=Leptolyngbya ohadii TaxID=1962290 RepID=UPI001CECACD5|nr:HetP family heterocyst commitment protein [Leptolyngbya ohadii]
MQFSSSIASSKRNKVMTPEQFHQVVMAITEGRYSWACVLILRFAGYNPVHFIPYRTYSRLVKENSLHHSSCHSPEVSDERSQDRQIGVGSASGTPSQSFVKVNDLSHLEAMASSETDSHGGCCPAWLLGLAEESDLPDFIQRSLSNATAQIFWN